MDENSVRSIYEQKIDAMIETLLPNGAGTITASRLREAMLQVAQTAATVSEDNALMSLMTADDVAIQFGVSVRRIRAIAKVKNSQFGVGWQVPGTSQWLFRPSEIETLRPGKPGRPSKED